MGTKASKYEAMGDILTVEELFQYNYLNWIKENWDNYKFFDAENKRIDLDLFKKRSINIFDTYFSKFKKSHFPAGIKTKNFYFVLILMTYLDFQGAKLNININLFTVSYKNLFMMMLVCEEFKIAEDIVNIMFHLVNVNKKFIDITYYEILKRQAKKECNYPKYLEHFKPKEPIIEWSIYNNQEFFLEGYLKKEHLVKDLFLSNANMSEINFMKINEEGFLYSEIKKTMKNIENEVNFYHGQNAIKFKLKPGLNASLNDIDTKKIKYVMLYYLENIGYYNITYFYCII